MLIRVPQLLDAAQLQAIHAQLLAAGELWVDGRATAGSQGARVKRNSQLPEDSLLAQALGDVVLVALESSALFVSATLPSRVYPPLFNRYAEGMAFGDHIDNAVRLLPGRGEKIRTDVSATLFLSDPASYDGGELVIEDTYGSHTVKLPAGDLIVYPASSVHRVTPVTRGARLASFFWVQSLVRDESQRALLFELDQSLQRLTATQADADACTRLAGTYHNLLRRWANP